MFSNTLFCELVKLIDMGIWKKIIRTHKSDRYGKSFNSHEHLIAMLHCQFSGSQSLREAEISYNNQSVSHHHLRLKALKRSTLSDANQKRSPAIFRDLASNLISKCNGLSGEVSGLLTILDSSPIICTGRNNQWTKDTSCNRIKGLKLHISLEPSENKINYFEITDSKVNDITEAKNIILENNKIYVFDKGYCDYNWWHEIHDKNSVFVTRLKNNCAYKVIENNAISDDNKGFILKDQVIVLTNKAPRAKKKNTLAFIPLRLITIARPDKETPLVLVCNDLQNTSEIIAGYYKERWKIELFFKWIKRYLKIKTLLGESKNSIKIQIFTAIIAYLLMWIWNKLSKTTDYTNTKTINYIKTKLFHRLDTEKYVRKKQSQSQNNNNQLRLAL
jgi:putative transposase